MSASIDLKPRRGLNLQRLAQDFSNLDPNNPGQWPWAPKVALLAALFAAMLALAWWFDWRDQSELLVQREQEEQTLRDEWISKKRQAINLDEHRQQLAEIDRQFGALLRQLPNRAEMESMLSDINQAGLGRGLQFELFKPDAERVKDFYAEMPIAISIVGSYHDLGAFAADVARMSRIVTLNNVALEGTKEGALKMNATAVTYRYLDEEELVQKRASTQNPNAR